MMSKVILYIIVAFSFVTCNQNKKENNSLNKKNMSNQISKTVTDYKQYPNYSIQVDKGGCRVKLIGNDVPLYNISSKGGFSSLIPFNLNIRKSGEQTLLLKIYPDQGKTTFDDYTRVSIQIIYFANDKDTNSPKIILQKFEIPKEVIEKKLPYFETVIKFIASVPFNFNENFEQSEDLTKINDIKEKSILTYEKIRKWIENKELENLSKYRRKSDIKYCSVFYIDDVKKIEEEFNYSFLFDDKKVLNPMPQFDVVFYGNGKLVRLEKIDDSSEVITLTGKTDDGFEITSDLNVILHMPKGSKVLEQY